MARWRLGVALLLPEPVSAEINGLRRALGDGGLDRIPPHITLVPPVNVRDDALAAGLATLRAACSREKPFSLELGPVTTFAPATPVLKLDVGGEALDTLTRLRDAVFLPPFERELTWPFVPHVTLCDGASEEQIEAATKALTGYSATVAFDRLWLLQEEEGRAWKAVADFPFREPSVVGRGGMPVELTVSQVPDPQTVGVLMTRPRDTDLTVTARRDGEVLGAMTGRRRGDDLVVKAISVAPAARGQGIAAHVLAAFVSAASDAGARRLVSGIGPCADRGAFLARHGFVEGVRPL